MSSARWLFRSHLVAVVGLVLGCAVQMSFATPVCDYEVVNVYPHDEEAYTQGLLFHDAYLYESTGLRGKSTLRKVILTTGAVVMRHDLPVDKFGEGITLFDGEIIQLTWTGYIGYVYELETFGVLDTFAYDLEGWGLTDDGQRLIASDGTTFLHFRDPATYEELGSVQVFDDSGPVTYLNELEFINGEVFANVYLTDQIVRIAPDSGEVIAWIDLTGLLDPWPSGAGVLNGIAYDSVGDRLFVTGKEWPSLFEIELTGCESLPLFRDGFATGDTSRWSQTVR